MVNIVVMGGVDGFRHALVRVYYALYAVDSLMVALIRLTPIKCTFDPLTQSYIQPTPQINWESQNYLVKRPQLATRLMVDWNCIITWEISNNNLITKTDTKTSPFTCQTTAIKRAKVFVAYSANSTKRAIFACSDVCCL